MSETFHIKNVFPLADVGILNKAIFLHIFRADCAPPHLALLIQGSYFDLGYKGPCIRDDLDVLLKIIEQKSIKALFIELQIPLHFSAAELKEKMKNSVLQYQGLKPEQTNSSCLSPIKDFCRWAYRIDCSKVNFVFDLLPILYRQNIAGNAYQINMGNLVKDTIIELKKYTRQDINNRIRELQKG